MRKGVTLDALRQLHTDGVNLLPVNVEVESRALTASIISAEDWVETWAPELVRIGIEKVTCRSIIQDAEESAHEKHSENTMAETAADENMEIVAESSKTDEHSLLSYKEFTSMVKSAQDIIVDFPELRYIY